MSERSSTEAVVPADPSQGNSSAYRRIRKANASRKETPKMKMRWEKPTFEYVPLGAEVTAYLGTSNPI